MNFDLIIIGSGPGGYVAAIRASQLGMKVGVVEKAELGGVCLNWGCIPTKSLLKSASVYEYLSHAADYGITIEGKAKADFEKMIARSRGIAEEMNKGVQFLFKKNKIEHLQGTGSLLGNHKVEVTAPDGGKDVHTAPHIILATGAESMLVVGSGAIGSEFAYLYHTIGTKVTLVEFMPSLVPLEDEEVSKALERSFKKAGMEVMTSAAVESVDLSGKKCRVVIKTAKGQESLEADVVFSAVGITPNLEGIGIEKAGITLEKGKVKVDEFYRTSVEGICAIGDIVPGPALAHVASAEGIICVEKIAGKNPQPLNYKNIPACTYTMPEIASVGYTEKTAKEAGYEIKVGKFPFTASGKAKASGHREGFIKLIFDAKYGELLGAHMIGANVTEMIAEIVVARNLETTGHEMIKSIHPHPTMSEAIMEAAAAAYGEVIHL
jgi:dihydrolipoamide dehydrogenase